MIRRTASLRRRSSRLNAEVSAYRVTQPEPRERKREREGEKGGRVICIGEARSNPFRNRFRPLSGSLPSNRSNPIGALMVRVSVDRQDRSPCYFDNGVAHGRGVN